MSTSDRGPVAGDRQERITDPETIHRFVTKIEYPEQYSTEECFEWGGAPHKDDDDLYGKFWLSGQCRRTHRVAYRISAGPIPAEMCILHSCHNRRCVNTEHLRLGTPEENTKDAIEEGTFYQPSAGERRDSLTDEQVRRIRDLREKGWTHKDIADEVGTSRATVGRVLRGELYADIE